MKFKVNIKEVHYLEVLIEAATAEEARQKVEVAYNQMDETAIDLDGFDYSHTFPVAEWTVSENHDQL